MVTLMFSEGTNLLGPLSRTMRFLGGVVLLFALLPFPCASVAVGVGENTLGVFLPSNRIDTRGIQRAKKLIAKGEFSQAIRFLDEILARDEDSFVVASNDEYRGLKETARRLIRDLPPEGRRIYEVTFGPVALRLLRQATDSGDFEQLRFVAQRYFYTPAGHEGALLFAQNEADLGHHLTAALTYQQLLNTPEAAARFQPQLAVLAATSWQAASNPSQATEVLRSLGEQGHRSVRLAGQDIPVRAASGGLLDWLEKSVGTPVLKDRTAERQWLTSRGNPARNGQTEGGLPHLRVRWQVRLLEHHHLETVHEEMAGLLIQQKKPLLPAASPLAVGNYVITRSAHSLVAIDFRTGKRIWQALPERVSLLEDLMEGPDRENTKNANNAGENLESARVFARMIWEDYLYNSTSSDGKRVYTIRDLAPTKTSQIHGNRFMANPRLPLNQTGSTNRLCAYDLPTQGKLVWEIDGATRHDKLQGAFFLGAPVQVGQSLYCLVEMKSETAIYLVALDRKTGTLRWRQQLANLEKGVSRDRKRRLQASMPSYEGGMLICPTGAGVVVGVDLAKHALAWAYRYAPKGQLSARQRILNAKTLPVAKGQWIHSAPVIAKGRVLLTPPESGDLHCVDLLTGKLLWKQPRGEALFLAGVEDGNVLLVGKSDLTALKLSDGKPAWSTESLELPAESTPTGSGFFSKGKYFLPLSNAQVIAVDVSRGTQVAEANSRDGQQLGNLICYRGAVISQTGRFLDCFEQVEVLQADSERRLAADPTDHVALRTLGEIAYNEGQLPQAIELLRQAYKSEPEEMRTREVLGEALVAALDGEFAEYQNLLPLLAQLQQGSAEEKFTLMRLQSKGLLKIGRADEAFEVCLEAYENLIPLETELSIGFDHQVISRRWLAAQVASTWAAAGAEQRTQIKERLATVLAKTNTAKNPHRLQSFYDSFGAIDLTPPLGIELATDYLDLGETLAAQQLLLDLVESKEPSVRLAAIALNSRLLHESHMPYLAASFDRQLQGSLADKECLAGMTGLECLQDWATTKLPAPSDWPYGQVEVSVEKSPIPTRSANLHVAGGRGIPQTGVLLGRTDAVLGRCNVTLHGLISGGRNRAITIRDSLGREFFRAKLDQGPQAMMNLRGSVFAVSRGNLLIVSLGRQIIAFDTLLAVESAERTFEIQPLWHKSTSSNLNQLNQQGLHQSKAAPIGPLTRNGCIFQIGDRLVCVDSQTGEIQWSRDNLPLGCDLFGDEEFLFAVPKGKKQPLIFSAVDGRSLGEITHRIPSAYERLTTVGRQIIRWRRRADRRIELSLIDALQGDEIWSQEFERNSKINIAQNRFAAVVEPSGRVAIVDLKGGQLLVDQPIQKNVLTNEIHLLAGTESFVLAVQQPLAMDKLRRVSPLSGGVYGAGFTRKAFAGQVYVFDRNTGLPLWERPAEVEGLPLMLSQAVDLPMIAFAGNIHRRDHHGSKQELGVMLLEKSTGRMLFHDDTLPPSPHQCTFQVSEEKSDEATVEMKTRKIKLKFTDRPRAPEPPAMQKAQRKIHKKSGGLQKIGEKFFGGGL